MMQNCGKCFAAQQQRQMLGELGPLSVNPCRALMQTSLSVKSQNALVSVDSVSRNQALFLLSRLTRSFLSPPIWCCEQTRCTQANSRARSAHSFWSVYHSGESSAGLRVIKIAGIRMPELAFSMSSNLFLIMTTFPWRNNTSERTFNGNYSSSALQKLCI